MKYTLIVTTDPAKMAQLGPRMQDFQNGFFALNRELVEKKVYLAGEPLDGPETATTVRGRGGRITTVDGPFAETKELVGGVYILECTDKAEALRWAERMPVVTLDVGSVEVRPCCVLEE